jgi:hypothetical protein
MRNRSLFGALLLTVAVIPITSCMSSASLTSITINPATINFGGAGLTVQLIATGYYNRPKHATYTRDITNEVNWISAATGCVTVDQNGLITSGANICSNIPVTASAQGFHGFISAFMTVNVTQPGAPGSATALTLSHSTLTSDGKFQFSAAGTTAKGGSVPLTGSAVWTSTDNQVATIDKTTGVVTPVGAGRTTISAVYTNPDGTTAVGVTHFIVPATK